MRTWSEEPDPPLRIGSRRRGTPPNRQRSSRVISGKVNGVDYQPGKPDAFYYRYAYDAENRLTDVKTSRDSIFWEDDVRYAYYKHGPLERMVLGKLSVQGLDYSYTLQGWLKGINIGNGFAGVMPDGSSCPPGSALADVDVSSRPATGGPAEYFALNSITFDSGFETFDNDVIETDVDPSLAVCTLPGSGNSGGAGGTGGAGSVEGFPVALDAYNYSLHYYPNDYTTIGSATPVVDVLQAMPSDAAPLYNGNIAAMAVNLPAVGDARVYNYHYDQLNRIAQMDAFSGLNMSSYTFTPVKLQDYQERVTYDPNGNIGTYTRNGFGSSLAMDNLTYNYYSNTNRLSSIHDVAGGSYTTDLKDQGAGNYTYDAIGNLKQDAANGVSNINWTVYGKISSVTNGSGAINYTYDATGNRITKTVGSTTSLYVRDAQGNVLSIYTIPSGGTPQQTEVDLYGSSRLGTLRALTVAPAPVNMGNQVTGLLNIFTRGERSYELANHLGNVLATVTDKKIAVSSDGSLIASYKADVVTAQDYYPFGMQMPGRTFAASGVGAYRYGFNGKERDDEVKGAGNEIDYGMRVYDPRAGRFMSVDPLVSEYPYYTPYQYAGNKPIWYVDLDGLEEAIPKLQLSIPKLTNVSESTCIGCAQRNDFIHRAKDQDNEARLKDGYDAWISNPDNIGKSLPPQYSKFASQVVDQQHLGVGGYEATPEYKITKANYDTYGKYLPILSDIEGVKDIGEALKEGKVSDATIFAAGLLLPAIGGKIFKGPLHHIFTNKNFILGQQWSKKFGPLFEKAGYALDDAINKVHVIGHAGPHPAEYHEEVYKRLLNATEGLEGAEYKKAFEGTLDQLSKEVSTPGTRLNKLITK